MGSRVRRVRDVNRGYWFMTGGSQSVVKKPLPTRWRWRLIVLGTCGEVGGLTSRSLGALFSSTQTEIMSSKGKRGTPLCRKGGTSPRV